MTESLRSVVSVSMGFRVKCQKTIMANVCGFDFRHYCFQWKGSFNRKDTVGPEPPNDKIPIST
ncbi:hypothetical protein CR513_35267, partial [Mucuna pruriens]